MSQCNLDERTFLSTNISERIVLSTNLTASNISIRVIFTTVKLIGVFSTINQSVTVTLTQCSLIGKGNSHNQPINMGNLG